MREFRPILTKTAICLLLLAGFVIAQSGTKHYFEQGNQAYRDGNYQNALEWYYKIIEVGYEGSQVYYNLGNCYYKLDQIGKAILYYEKARKFNPDDKEILFNLELANLKVIDRIEMPPNFFLFQWWDNLKSYFTIHELTKIVVIFYVTSMLILTLFLFFRYQLARRFMIIILTCCAVLTIFSTYILVLNIQESHETPQAIVLATSVNIMSAPDENSTDVFILHEGVKVALDEQRGGWVKISLPDGKSGWMKQDYLGVI